jgi:hypothetical protein
MLRIDEIAKSQNPLLSSFRRNRLCHNSSSRPSHAQRDASRDPETPDLLAKAWIPDHAPAAPGLSGMTKFELFTISSELRMRISRWERPQCEVSRSTKKTEFERFKF